MINLLINPPKTEVVMPKTVEEFKKLMEQYKKKIKNIDGRHEANTWFWGTVERFIEELEKKDKSNIISEYNHFIGGDGCGYGVEKWPDNLKKIKEEICEVGTKFFEEYLKTVGEDDKKAKEEADKKAKEEADKKAKEDNHFRVGFSMLEGILVDKYKKKEEKEKAITDYFKNYREISDLVINFFTNYTTLKINVKRVTISAYADHYLQELQKYNKYDTAYKYAKNLIENYKKNYKYIITYSKKHDMYKCYVDVLLESHSDDMKGIVFFDDFNECKEKIKSLNRKPYTKINDVDKLTNDFGEDSIQKIILFVERYIDNLDKLSEDDKDEIKYAIETIKRKFLMQIKKQIDETKEIAKFNMSKEQKEIMTKLENFINDLSFQDFSYLYTTIKENTEYKTVEKFINESTIKISNKPDIKKPPIKKTSAQEILQQFNKNKNFPKIDNDYKTMKEYATHYLSLLNKIVPSPTDEIKEINDYLVNYKYVPYIKNNGEGINCKVDLPKGKQNGYDDHKTCMFSIDKPFSFYFVNEKVNNLINDFWSKKTQPKVEDKHVTITEYADHYQRELDKLINDKDDNDYKTGSSLIKYYKDNYKYVLIQDNKGQYKCYIYPKNKKGLDEKLIFNTFQECKRELDKKKK